MSGKKAITTKAELDEAVEALLGAFALPEEEEPPVQSKARPNLDGAEQQKGTAPSGDVGALWGESKPRKK